MWFELNQKGLQHSADLILYKKKANNEFIHSERKYLHSFMSFCELFSIIDFYGKIDGIWN